MHVPDDEDEEGHCALSERPVGTLSEGPNRVAVGAYYGVLCTTGAGGWNSLGEVQPEGLASLGAYSVPSSL